MIAVMTVPVVVVQKQNNNYLQHIIREHPRLSDALYF